VFGERLFIKVLLIFHSFRMHAISFSAKVNELTVHNTLKSEERKIKYISHFIRIPGKNFHGTFA